MPNSNVMGINEEKLTSVITSINDDIMKISNIFENMETIMADSGNCLSGELGNSLQTKFNEIKMNFPIIKNNLLTYSTELTNIKNNYVGYSINGN